MTGFCLAAAFTMVAAGAAQERTSTTTSDQRTSTTTAGKDDVTVTGCLSRGADGKFMLNNVARSEETNKAASTTASAGRAPSATGTTGAAGAAAAQSWTLEGKDNDLAAHVGHRVELKGHLMPSASASTTTAPGASASTTTASGASAAAGAVASAKLDVESVRMVAATCGS
jgi:hypothetical protein